MKRTIRAILVFVLALAALMPFMPAQSASAASKAATWLSSGVNYSINLNGGSAKERVRWTAGTKSTSSGSRYIFRLYVDGKQVYKKSYAYALGSSVGSMDINTGDKYKELIVRVTSDSGCTEDYFVLRYYNQNKVKRYSATNVGRAPSIISNTGKNKFFLQIDTPFDNQNFGCNHVKMAYTLSGNKVKRMTASTFILLHPFVELENNYSLKKSMKLYSGSSKKNVKGTLSAGTSFTTLKIKPGSKHTKTDSLGYKTVCYDLFVQVKTDSGKTGWLFFPAFASNPWGDYLTSVPGWG